MTCLGFIAPVGAREHPVEHWGTADGLPVNAVNRLLVGQPGYLWVFTGGGGIARRRRRTFHVSAVSTKMAVIGTAAMQALVSRIHLFNEQEYT